MLLTTIVWAIAAEESGLWNGGATLRAGAERAAACWKRCAFTYVVVMALGFLYRHASYSRLVIANSAVAFFVLATAAIALFSGLPWNSMRRSGRNEVRILMVGADRFARRVAATLLHGEVLPCKVVGFVRVPGEEIAVDGPVYEMDQLSTFSNAHSINDVVIALPATGLSEIQRIAPALEKLSVPTRVVIDLGEGVGIRDRLINLGGINMLDLRPTLAETTPYLFQKRIFDVTLSIIILLLSLPLSLLIALAIKASSRGPVFFIQERVGLSGRVFRMLKFRTMRVGKPRRGGHALDLVQ